MENLNWGYFQLGLVTLAFGGLQLWWISSVYWRHDCETRTIATSNLNNKEK